MEQFEIQSATGAVLNTYALASDGPPIGIIQINHGMVEHAARYKRFMTALAGAGFASIAHDQRGHGHTKAEGAPLGRYAAEGGHSLVLKDINAIYGEIGRRWPGLPVITFGHSAGALMALNFAITHPEKPAGLAIWNANTSPGLMGRLGEVVLLAEGALAGPGRPSMVLKNLTFSTWNKGFAPNRTEFDWLSRDEAEVDMYANDPLCGFDASVSMWSDILRLARQTEDTDLISRLPKDLPIHILGGDKDPATNNAQACRELAVRFQRGGFTDVTLKIMRDTRHEALNELNREEVTNRFCAWARRVAGVEN